MNKEWWEEPTCILCDYWWLFLILLIFALALYFARGPIVDLVIDTKTPTPTSTFTVTPSLTPISTFTPPPTTTPGRGLSDVEVSRRKITISVRDDGKAVDGDIIDVRVNGKLVLEDFTLEEDKRQIPVVLVSGENIVVVTAKNQGYSGPNTVEVSVSDVVRGESVQVSRGLKTGEEETFSIWAPEGTITP